MMCNVRIISGNDRYNCVLVVVGYECSNGKVRAYDISKIAECYCSSFSAASNIMSTMENKENNK